MIKRKSKESNQSNSIQYDTSDEPIVISKHTIDILLQTEYPTQCIALYSFLYYTAKWQKTNQPKATAIYIGNTLNWSEKYVRKIKSILINLHLIENLCIVNEKTGKVMGWYIKVNFLWKKTTMSNISRVAKTTRYKNHPVVKVPPNALSANNKNALSANNFVDEEVVKQQKPLNGSNPKILKDRKRSQRYIRPQDFDKWWAHYPRKAQKGKAKTAWNKLCAKKPKTDTPSLATIIKATKEQKKTKQWLNHEGTFIPYPSTYLNNMRWLDDIDEMNKEHNYNQTKSLHAPNALKSEPGKYSDMYAVRN